MHCDGCFFYEGDYYQLSMSFQRRGDESNESGNGNTTKITRVKMEGIEVSILLVSIAAVSFRSNSSRDPSALRSNKWPFWLMEIAVLEAARVFRKDCASRAYYEASATRTLCQGEVLGQNDVLNPHDTSGPSAVHTVLVNH